jgi:hypothetical protein
MDWEALIAGPPPGPSPHAELFIRVHPISESALYPRGAIAARAALPGARRRGARAAMATV